MTRRIPFTLLPPAETLTGDEILAIDQDGETRQSPLVDLAALISGGTPTPGSVVTASFDPTAKAPLAGAADTATTAGSATTATTATTATDADHATTADTADEATHATTADSADSAATAANATTADSAAEADSLNPANREAILRGLCLCVPFGSAHSLAGKHPTTSDAPYVSRTGCHYGIQQTAVLYKTHSRKGLVTALTPSTLAGGTRGQVIYAGDVLHQIVISGSTGFIVMDVDNDSFGSIVNPTGWGQTWIQYHVGSGYLYYAGTDRPRRCTLAGGSVSAGTALAGTCGRMCLVGDLLFVIDDGAAIATKVYKYDTASWGTQGASITLGGDCNLDSGLAHHTGNGYLLVGEYDGTILVVNPTTLATVATITLSGVAARVTQHIIYDATVDRIYALDALGKLWVIDGTTYAIIGYCLPSDGVSVTAMTNGALIYDPDAGLLTVRSYDNTIVYRFRA